MNLAELGRTVAKFAPMLGRLLPIPYAGVAGDLIASAFGVENEPQSIANAIRTNPDAAIILAKIEAENAPLLQQQLLTAETTRLQAVNKTMQAETKSEHWAQWLWRPYNGFLFGTTLFFVYALPSIINAFAPIWFKPALEQVLTNGVYITNTVATWLPIKAASVPEFVFVAWGSVLGVTAWHRGKEKTARAGGIK